jgi:phosphate transport system substrate-binding protein
MKNKLFLKVMAAVTGITLLSGGYAFAAKNITIKGSTTLLPIAQACAEAFMNQHLDVDISVQGGGSGVGIASIIDDTADIGDASRPAKDKEIAMGKENGVDVYENVVALDGIAVIIHPGNPVAGLNKDQIKDIYTGKISNWKEVGGNAAKIVVVSRDSASGTFETFNKLALDDEKVRPDALLQASNQAVAMTISRTKGAIGYIGMGYLSNAVKGVNVNGISPTKENVIDGSYILARKLFMYTNGKPKGATADFILFVLSDDGQKIVEKEGFVPIK